MAIETPLAEGGASRLIVAASGGGLLEASLDGLAAASAEKQ
jgi:hypothetical protein